MNDKVVYLKFDNPKLPPDFAEFVLACVNCKNKTFIVIEDDPNKFRLMRCCVCGANIGRFGWADADT